MKYVAIIAALHFAVLFTILFYEKPAHAKAEPAKPVCVEANLKSNPNESIVLCGKQVSYDQVFTTEKI